MANTFKQTNNAKPTYGESSASVLALQKKLNADNKGKQGYTAIAEDSKYGDQTKNAVGFTSATGAIPADTIAKTETPIDAGTKPVDNTDLLTKTALGYNTDLTKATVDQNTSEDSVSSLLKSLQGEGAYRSGLEETAGVDKTQNRLRELQGLAQAETNNLESGILRNENNAIGTMETRGFLNGQDTRARRESAINSLVINSEAQMLQGNLENATRLIDRAVSAKYDPLKAEKEQALFNLQRADKHFDSAEKKVAETTKMKLEKDIKDADQRKEFATTILKNGAPSALREAVLNATSVDEMLKIKGIENYLTSPKEKLELDKLGWDIKKTKNEYLKTVSALNAAKQTLGGTTGDVTSDLILGSSAYSGKQPSAGWIDDFTQSGVALGNVKELQKLIDKQGTTGLIKGNVASLFGKFDSDYSNAAAINAQIQRTVPGLARGIFKEVGVLTDQDISNYKKTLPNLTSPAQQNKLALLATYDVIERSMALSLANQAKAKNDVSGYYDDYNNVKSEVKQLKSELGFTETANITPENKAKLEGAWTTQFSPQNITNTLDSFLK